MSPLYEQLGLDQIDPQLRLALAHEIIGNYIAEAKAPAFFTAQVDGEPPALKCDHQQLIDERLAAYKSNPDNIVPWEQVKSDALARFGS